MVPNNTLQCGSLFFLAMLRSGEFRIATIEIGRADENYGTPTLLWTAIPFDGFRSRSQVNWISLHRSNRGEYSIFKEKTT